jgi:hypothetical protein
MSGYLQHIELLPTSSKDIQQFLHKGKVFQGGNARTLHKLLEVTSGDAILYAGDHIYADTIRSKRSLGWRTCLIVPELTKEIASGKNATEKWKNILKKRKLEIILEKQIDAFHVQVRDLSKKVLPIPTHLYGEAGESRSHPLTNEERNQAVRELIQLKTQATQSKAEIDKLKAEITLLIEEYNSCFHPRWGQVTLQ